MVSARTGETKRNVIQVRTVTINGVVYVPSAQVSSTGSSGATSTGLTIAADNFHFSGNSTISAGATSVLTLGTPGLVQ